MKKTFIVNYSSKIAKDMLDAASNRKYLTLIPCLMSF